MLELRICGGVEIEVDGHVLPESLIGGRQGRLVLAYLACERDRAVRREELAELLWADELPESWTASLSAVISRLRRLFTEAGLDGPAVVVSTPGAYQLHLPRDSRIDLEDLVAAVGQAEDAAASGDADGALRAATSAAALAARGFLADDCEWVDQRRDAIRDLRVRCAIAESIAHLHTRASGRAIEAARRAVELDGTKEAAYRQLMVALAEAGERAEALRIWERCRVTLVDELGIDPSPETEAVYLGLLDATGTRATTTQLPSGVVTFLLTDIVESSALWEQHTAAMATALERHDAIVGTVVATHGGTLLKSKLEGDATVSVFARATEGATAALALLDAIESEPWPEGVRARLRMAMHTGEAFERGGDYFGPALNRAARLRGLAGPNEVLLSQAVAELVRDHLPHGVVLRDRGLQTLRGLSRGENVFELTRAGRAASGDDAAPAPGDDPLGLPPVPAALIGTSPFVGRGGELAQLNDLWQRSTAGEASAVFVGGEPGVGKSRLAGEVATRAHHGGGLVLYGRCDEDLAAPLQPFIEAVRALAPVLGETRLRAVRGIDELTRVLPELTAMLGERPANRADPDTERLALFDAVTQLLVAASKEAPVLLVLDDLHWAGKTTLSLLRHLLRGMRGSQLLVVGTYRDTELARTHPLAETLADLRRDADIHRVALGGLGADDVAAYLHAVGNTDRALGRELAEVTAGNPFFLIEVVRHVEESGGSWQPGSLPEGVREATGRRLSRLSDTANDALAVAAVVGARFDLALVEQVRGVELVDPIAEAVQAGLVVEEPGSLAQFRFAHAIVRQVLLSELVSLKRVRLHRTIAELLENSDAPADPDARLADLAYHWFECAAAGSGDRAVDACRRAGDRAIERLAYEEAGDLYGMALQALECVDAPDAHIGSALHLARCDALLTAGDVAGARDALDALELAAAGSERLAAWYTTYEGLLTVLSEPDRLTEIVQSIGAAAGAMRDVGDLTGEAKAHYVHASALERLGQIGAAERALDSALAAARNADDRRLADAILAEAPPAQLWGPSPVTRASGRCLDVVRVLRITSGTPAVEAVALRCQAVLEALRGRMDAARRMVRSSRRTVEQLGLTHRRLEADLAAGLIELLAREAAAAEELLRDAYEGLRERGIDGEAAQAGAFLARALLLQGRIDEADEIAADAERLAGADLKAAIAWRVVRAEAAANRGDTARALALSREAVELASSTDALLLVADARLTLASVLRAAGDVAAADAEARRALEACEAKGATVLAALAREAMAAPPDAPAIGSDPKTVVRERRPIANLAMAQALRFQEAFNRGDWAAVDADRAPGLILDDRRPVVGMTFTVGTNTQEREIVYPGGGRFEPLELLATRGDRLALCRWLLRGPDMEVPYLAISRTDAAGRAAEYVMFEPEALDEAMAALDAMAASDAWGNEATRMADRVIAAYEAHDWDMIQDCYAADWSLDDRRWLVRLSSDHEQSIANSRLIFEAGSRFTGETIATRGEYLCLERWTIWVPDPEATETVLLLMRADTSGRQTLTVMLNGDDLDTGFAELDRLFLEGEGAAYADVIALGSALITQTGRFDHGAVAAPFSPKLRVCDHRTISVPELEVDAWLGALDEMRGLYGRGRGRIEHISDLSERGGLWCVDGEGELADGGQWKIRLLVTLEITEGQITGLDFYDDTDVDAARAALSDVRFRCAPWLDGTATRVTGRIHAAYRDHDWDALMACLSDDFRQEDRRASALVYSDYEASLASVRLIFDARSRIESDVLAARGSSLLLSRSTVSIREPQATAASLAICEVTTGGLQRRVIMFDADDLDTAFAELDRVFLEGEGAEHADVLALGTALMEALRQPDVDALATLFAPEVRVRDHRPLGAPELDGAAWLETLRDMHRFSPNSFRIEHVSDLSERGGLWCVDGEGELTDGGQWNLRILVAFEVANGAIVALDFHDADDIETARAALAARPPTAEWSENDATRHAARVQHGYQQDWETFRTYFSDSLVSDDRRAGMRSVLDCEQSIAGMRLIFDGGARFERETVATRGQRLCLDRWTIFVPDPEATDTVLTLTRLDDIGRQDLAMLFDLDDLDSALAELDRLFLEGEGAERPWYENDATRAIRRVHTAYNAHDWDALLDCYADGWAQDDRRSVLAVPLDPEQSIAGMRLVFQGNGTFHGETLATRGRSLALTRTTLHVPDPEVLYTVLILSVADEDGRTVRSTMFDEDNVDGALAELDRLFSEGEGANAAWRAALRVRAAANARDWEQFVEAHDPTIVYTDNRQGVRLRLEGDEVWATYRAMFALDEFRWVSTLLSTRGENLALSSERIYFSDGIAGAAEVGMLGLIESGADGRVLSNITFDFDDLGAAQAELEARYAELSGESVGNAAWRAAARASEALNRRDWDGFLGVLSPDLVSIDHHRLTLTGADALATYRILLSLDEFRHERTLVATRGERLALIHDLVVFRDGDAGPAEAEAYSLYEVDEHGLACSIVSLSGEDLDASMAALDARAAELSKL